MKTSKAGNPKNGSDADNFSTLLAFFMKSIMKLSKRFDSFKNDIINILVKIPLKNLKREWKEGWSKNHAMKSFEKSITVTLTLEFYQ